jgi:hypothetical protein
VRGFIFTEFVELIEQQFGEELADRLLDSTSLASGGAYTAVDNYDHEELVRLVAKLSDLVDVPVADLLQSFGVQLFEFLARSHSTVMTNIGDPFDLFDQLESHIHAEVRKLYPNAEVPFFDTERTDSQSMRLSYRSSRAMPDLAEGLIMGACRHFDRGVEIRREDRSGGKGTDVDFFVTLTEP